METNEVIEKTRKEEGGKRGEEGKASCASIGVFKKLAPTS